MRFSRVLAGLMLIAAPALAGPNGGMGGGVKGPPGSGGTPSNASVTVEKMATGDFGYEAFGTHQGFSCLAGTGCYANLDSITTNNIQNLSIIDQDISFTADIQAIKLYNLPTSVDQGNGVIDAVSSSNVQSAIEELNTKKLSVANSVHIDQIQNQVYDATTEADWSAFNMSALTTTYDTIKEALNVLARYARGGYDIVVDVDGDTDACATIQRLAIKPWLETADYSGSGAWGPTFRVKVHGTASVARTATKDIGNHRVCMMLGGSPDNLDANGYPSNVTGSIDREDKRLFLNLDGLDLTVNNNSATEPMVVLQVGGHATNWASEFTAAVNNSVDLKGSPRLGCANFNEGEVGGTYRTTWPQSRANAMTGTGALFDGGSWAPGSCITLLENHARRNEWSDFHPKFFSYTNPNHDVGWLAVAAWQTNRGMFESNGAHTSFQVYGNMAAGSVGLRGGGVYGFICGDHNAHSCSGLRVREGQLEGSIQSEMVINSGIAAGNGLLGAGPGDLTFANMHIESEGEIYAANHPTEPLVGYGGRSPHIIIGPGYGVGYPEVDSYRPCVTEWDNPTRDTCACPVTDPLVRGFGTINFKNTSFPGTRYDKPFRLGAYGVGQTRGQFKACAVAGKVVKVHTADGDATATVVNTLDDLYWSGVTNGDWWDIIRVRFNSSSHPEYQPLFNSDELQCETGGVTYTAVIYNSAGGDNPFALGPCTYMTSSYNSDVSVINFNGSQVALDLVGDRAEREIVQPGATALYPVLFRANPASNLRMNYQGAAGYGPTTGAGPVSYPANLLLTDFRRFVPSSTTPPTTSCNRPDQAGQLYWDTDADSDNSGSLMVCKGADGWKSMR